MPQSIEKNLPQMEELGDEDLGVETINPEPVKSPENAAKEVIELAEGDLLEIEEAGEKDIVSADAASGLSAERLDAAKAEIGVNEGLGEIKKKGRSFFGRLKDGVSGLFSSSRVESGRPIAPDETFDPDAEVKKIWALPSGDREAALKRWKEKYVYQKVGLAKMQENFLEDVRQNPDMPQNELIAEMEKFSQEYGLSEKQKTVTLEAMYRYIKKHGAVADLREKYPDDKKIFGAMFGREPKGKIEVIIDPITVYIRCYDSEDYAFVVSLAYLKKAGEKYSAEDLMMASHSAGMFINKTMIPDFEGGVILENSAELMAAHKNDKKEADRESKKVGVHEEQHALKRLFDEEPATKDNTAGLEESIKNNDWKKVES
ncbi:MAG: hypothetical protein AAB731_03935, partial [Patescibacteria group bacterium]